MYRHLRRPAQVPIAVLLALLRVRVDEAVKGVLRSTKDTFKKPFDLFEFIQQYRLDAVDLRNEFNHSPRLIIALMLEEPSRRFAD